MLVARASLPPFVAPIGRKLQLVMAGGVKATGAAAALPMLLLKTGLCARESGAVAAQEDSAANSGDTDGKRETQPAAAAAPLQVTAAPAAPRLFVIHYGGFAACGNSLRRANIPYTSVDIAHTANVVPSDEECAVAGNMSLEQSRLSTFVYWDLDRQPVVAAQLQRDGPCVWIAQRSGGAAAREGRLMSEWVEVVLPGGLHVATYKEEVTVLQNSHPRTFPVLSLLGRLTATALLTARGGLTTSLALTEGRQALHPRTEGRQAPHPRTDGYALHPLTEGSHHHHTADAHVLVDSFGFDNVGHWYDAQDRDASSPGIVSTRRCDERAIAGTRWGRWKALVAGASLPRSRLPLASNSLGAMTTSGDGDGDGSTAVGRCHKDGDDWDAEQQWPAVDVEDLSPLSFEVVRRARQLEERTLAPLTRALHQALERAQVLVDIVMGYGDWRLRVTPMQWSASVWGVALVAPALGVFCEGLASTAPNATKAVSDPRRRLAVFYGRLVAALAVGDTPLRLLVPSMASEF